MASFDPIPQARVVRKAGQLVAPPRAPRDEPGESPLRSALNFAIGMWPLTAIMLLIIGFIAMAGAVPMQFR